MDAARTKIQTQILTTIQTNIGRSSNEHRAITGRARATGVITAR
jgi:hypothetical protein